MKKIATLHNIIGGDSRVLGLKRFFNDFGLFGLRPRFGFRETRWTVEKIEVQFPLLALKAESSRALQVEMEQFRRAEPKAVFTRSEYYKDPPESRETKALAPQDLGRCCIYAPQSENPVLQQSQVPIFKR